jgi:glycosyltransferase involved in cell wall biosynthesis
MVSDLLEKLRQSRELIVGGQPASVFLTVYIGVYNGEEFLPEIKKFLESSYWDDFNLVVVDNASTDTSWEEIKRWEAFLKMPYKLVRNSINLGGGGSFELNKDLLKSEWVTFIHQDDIYFSNHLYELNNAAKSAKSEVIAISTEMGSMDHVGTLKYSTPRPIWLLKNKTPISYFLSNLKTHLVPWGSSIFRTREFLSVDLAWHSTAFPDTEMLLKMCALGEFVNLPIQTMLYRENPMSESHGLGNPEKEIAAVAALSRVFASQEFKKLAVEVEAARREEFLSEIRKGIGIRIQDRTLVKIVELIAEESLLIAWSYGEKNLVEGVSSKYADFGAKRVTELFDRMLGYESEMRRDFSAQDKEELKVSPPQNDNDLARNRAILEAVLKHLPYSKRRFFLKTLLKLKVSFTKNHPHKFSW